MQKFSLLIKRALFGAFFILSSCSPCSLWQYDSISSCDPCFQSAKIYYEPQNVFREPGVEISYNTDTGFSVFLNLYGCALPNQLINDSMIEVTLVINSNPIPILAVIYQGNQRILLPETCAQMIIESLLNKDEVVLKVGRYCITLPFDGFEKNYNKLAKII